MYKSIEYSENYSKMYGGLWQNHRDDAIDNITQSELFKYKMEMMWKTPAGDNKKNVKLAVPLKYFSMFWKNFEISLIISEISLDFNPA